jgi:hypothetical protein
MLFNAIQGTFWAPVGAGMPAAGAAITKASALPAYAPCELKSHLGLPPIPVIGFRTI